MGACCCGGSAATDVSVPKAAHAEAAGAHSGDAIAGLPSPLLNVAGLPLFFRTWLPEGGIGAAKAVVFLCHGLHEVSVREGYSTLRTMAPGATLPRSGCEGCQVYQVSVVHSSDSEHGAWPHANIAASPSHPPHPTSPVPTAAPAASPAAAAAPGAPAALWALCARGGAADCAALRRAGR